MKLQVKCQLSQAHYNTFPWRFMGVAGAEEVAANVRLSLKDDDAHDNGDACETSGPCETVATAVVAAGAAAPV